MLTFSCKKNSEISHMCHYKHKQYSELNYTLLTEQPMYKGNLVVCLTPCA